VKVDAPLADGVERRGLLTAPDERAGLGVQTLERALDAVVDIAEQSGPERERQWLAGQCDLIAGLEAVCVFVDLDGPDVAVTRMTSPIRRSGPTSTTSYMEAPMRPLASTMDR